jgi:nucleotide-binding universal stress UspA family protein
MTEPVQPDHPVSAASGASFGAGAIVVGLDGSAASRAALDHALDEAVLRDLPVVIATAFEPAIWPAAHGVGPSAGDQRHQVSLFATAVLDEALAERADRGAPVPTTRLLVRSGPAAVVLETLSLRAAHLVVGHRGRGAITSHLLGSVSLACVLHTRCPVTVVRGPMTEQDTAEPTGDHSTGRLDAAPTADLVSP